MRPRFIIPALLLSLVVVTAWGYSQYQSKRQWEINAENQYQRAFAELTTHVNNLETDLSKSLVAGSFRQNIRLLTDVWREANACQENLGQLPLTSLELSATKKLLASVGSFCFNTAQKKLLQGNRVTATEWEKLRVLRDRTRVMVNHLGNMQQKFLNSQSRWLEIDRLSVVGAAGMAANSQNNQVTRSFLMLEDGLKRTPDIAHEGNNLNFTPRPTGLTGRKVSSKKAVAIARHFLQSDYPRARVSYERKIGGDFPGFMVRAKLPNNPAQDLRCSVSAKGGHVTWFLTNRKVNYSRWGLDRCAVKATTFLSQNGYPDLQVVARESYANVATLTCAPQRGRVLYYPELVKVQVAQDNGAILGCDLIPYLTFYNPARPSAPKPAYSTRQIAKMLNPYFEVEKIRRVEVLDEMFNKVPCYEVAGTQDTDRYLIYYNAANGREEKIRRVDRNGNELL
jgi:spore germination protein